ncbi:uncharacterized protein FJT64_023250 [Amphibalanus amphitrite]|uniref:Uncharacterized protein n=1 Tax=Amphibalanus amphitrite TaxID=1232801 RepID=A0A6A4WSF8_AMPAM|nr:uncharacterized protein FJT64_023250 [Amphibalanus amphitrite]
MSSGSDDGAQPPCPRSPSPPRYAALGGDSYLSRSRDGEAGRFAAPADPAGDGLPPVSPAPSGAAREVPGWQAAAVSTDAQRFVVAELSAAELSAAELPAAELPAAELPAAELPAAELPAAELPAAELSAAELPAAELPAAELPAADLPAAELPAAELPAAALRGRAIRSCSVAVLCGRASRGWAFRGPVVVAAARVPRPARCRALR